MVAFRRKRRYEKNVGQFGRLEIITTPLFSRFKCALASLKKHDLVRRQQSQSRRQSKTKQNKTKQKEPKKTKQNKKSQKNKQNKTKHTVWPVVGPVVKPSSVDVMPGVCANLLALIAELAADTIAAKILAP